MLPCLSGVPAHDMLLVLLGFSAATTVGGYHIPQRPLVRRKPVESETNSPHQALVRRVGLNDEAHRSESSASLTEDFVEDSQYLQHEAFMEVAEASANTRAVDSLGRTCPGEDSCGAKADKLEFDKGCWDCVDSYQVFYCEKNCLHSPDPLFVDICAKEGTYRDSFCKKFAELNPPIFIDSCFFPNATYKELYCEKIKLKKEFKGECAGDAEVGAPYCEAFAVHMAGYEECNHWPTFMKLFCDAKRNEEKYDENCASHKELGPQFCEDFALIGEIKQACVSNDKYLKLFCDTKASENTTVSTCAISDQTAGMYCEELALKQNGFEDCFAQSSFAATFCAEVKWSHPRCPVEKGSAMR